MNIIILATVFFTSASWIMVIFLMFGIAVMYHFMRLKANPIDIPILEYNNQGICGLRFEIGRWQYVKNRGWRLLTAGFFPNSVKDNLGWYVKHKDMMPALKGSSRKAVVVAMKDKTPVPVEMLLKRKDLEDKDKKYLDEITKRYGVSCDVATDAESFSLKPVLSEGVNFHIEANKDKQELFNQQRERYGMSIIKWAIIGAVVILVLVMIATVVVMWKNAEAAQGLAQAGGQIGAKGISFINQSLPPVPG